MHSINRFHDFSCGHRVAGHESKCAHLHGHNYRVHFVCSSQHGELDELGRVVDFSVVKTRLCDWLEENWDHKFLLWTEDPLRQIFDGIKATVDKSEGPILGSEAEVVGVRKLNESFVYVPFNPTAENMAEHLVAVIGPQRLAGTGIVLDRCVVEETRKCSAAFDRRDVL